MKKVLRAIGKAIGIKAKKPIETTPVVVTDRSQQHVLRNHMVIKKMTHGETVNADISPVRVQTDGSGETVLYFCPMEKMKIAKKVANGDGGSLPSLATVHNLAFPKGFKEGQYKLKNVMITSNGTLQVHATAKTQWEPA